MTAGCLATALVLAACTADGEEQAAEPMPVEVQGEVLDRRDPEPDDETDDEVDEVDETDDGDEDGDTADDDGAEEAEQRSSASGSTSGDGTSGAGGATATPAPASPAPAPTASPARPVPARPAPPASPSPSPTPTPVVTPAPRTLAFGAAHPTGPVLDSDGTSWVETSSVVFEPGDPEPLTVGLLSSGDDAQRSVACHAALEAPSDRGLVARGTLTVSLRIVAPDDSVREVRRQILDLDVTLVPGRRLELPASPTRTFDVSEVRQITCVAEFTR